jgi:hypothetical protein
MTLTSWVWKCAMSASALPMSFRQTGQMKPSAIFCWWLAKSEVLLEGLAALATPHPGVRSLSPVLPGTSVA